MANRRRKTRGLGGTNPGPNQNYSADVSKLLQRAPQFKSLMRAMEGSEHMFTDSQRKFLDDFAAEIRRANANDNDAS